jgi:hypothetical protein
MSRHGVCMVVRGPWKGSAPQVSDTTYSNAAQLSTAKIAS